MQSKNLRKEYTAEQLQKKKNIILTRHKSSANVQNDTKKSNSQEKNKHQTKKQQINQKRQLTYIELLENIINHYDSVSNQQDFIKPRQQYTLYEDLILLTQLAKEENINYESYRKIASMPCMKQRNAEGIKSRQKKLKNLTNEDINTIIQYVKSHEKLQDCAIYFKICNNQNAFERIDSIQSPNQNVDQDQNINIKRKNDSSQEELQKPNKKRHLNKQDDLIEIIENSNDVQIIPAKKKFLLDHDKFEAKELDEICNIVSKWVNIPKHRVLDILEQVSGDINKFEQYIESSDESMLWTEDDDQILKTKNQDDLAFKLLSRHKGYDNIALRLKYLGINLK